MPIPVLEKTILDFEKRMSMRRKMMSVGGVVLKKSRRVPKEVEDLIRESIVNCHRCRSVAECEAWLQTASGGEAVPDFCPNLETLARFKAMGHSKTPAL